jgi:hypothetical protein
MTGWFWIGKNVEGSGRGLILFPKNTMRTVEIHGEYVYITIAHFRLDNRTLERQNMGQEW